MITKFSILSFLLFLPLTCLNAYEFCSNAANVHDLSRYHPVKIGSSSFKDSSTSYQLNCLYGLSSDTTQSIIITSYRGTLLNLFGRTYYYDVYDLSFYDCPPGQKLQGGICVDGYRNMNDTESRAWELGMRESDYVIAMSLTGLLCGSMIGLYLHKSRII